jgi:hypothetical protein
MYGDFEAQRHWMELTVNLPISQWLIFYYIRISGTQEVLFGLQKIFSIFSWILLNFITHLF